MLENLTIFAKKNVTGQKNINFFIVLGLNFTALDAHFNSKAAIICSNTEQFDVLLMIPIQTCAHVAGFYLCFQRSRTEVKYVKF